MSLTVDPGSTAGKLRAERERIMKDKTKTLPLPGWESLSVRYKRLPWEDAKALIDREPGDPQQEVSAALDTLIKACDEVLYLGESFPDGPLRFEQRLAQFIGDDEATHPAEVLMSLVADDETALMGHAGEFITWALRLMGEANEALGKS